MCRFIALDNMTRTITLIDENQKVALLHLPFKATPLFGGELAKLQKANTEHSSAITVFPAPATPLMFKLRDPTWIEARITITIAAGREVTHKREVAGAEVKMDLVMTARHHDCYGPTGSQ